MRAILSTIKLIIFGIWSFLAIFLGGLFYLFRISHKMPLIANYFWSPVVLPVLGARVKLINGERIDPNQSYLIMANHNSFIDIPVLFKTMPFFTYFIAKKELQKIPLLGWFIGAYGMIYVDRSNSSKAKDSIGRAAKLISAGKHVIIFPEGTKSKDGNIAPFKKGGFHLAAQANVPILPLKIVGARKVWPNKKPFKLGYGKIEVIVGEPILPETLSPMIITEQAAYVREYIDSL